MAEFVSLGLMIVSFLLLIAAAAHDAATRTIPNWISAGIAVAGLGLRVIDGGLLVGLGLAVGMFLLLGLLWLCGFMGGGDMKLIPAVSLVLPPASVPGYILLVSIAGGVLAALYLALSYVMRRPRPGQRHGFLSRVAKAEAWRMCRRGPLPYAVAIATGALPGFLRAFLN
jgi:prepilin peptidase CpaA